MYTVQMNERMSSGIEPAPPKRQHLTPIELQQRLSHLVGRPLGPKEMSQIIPNFPDLLGDFNKSGRASFSRRCYSEVLVPLMHTNSDNPSKFYLARTQWAGLDEEI